MDAGEAQVLGDIEKFGCHILSIMGEDGYPPFAYSIGIFRSTGLPDAVVVGLRQEVAHGILNEYCRRIRAGEQFTADGKYPDFIENFDMAVRPLDPACFAENFGWAMWLHQGPNFEMVQLVYPDMQGNFPWQAGVHPNLSQVQTLLPARGKK